MPDHTNSDQLSVHLMFSNLPRGFESFNFARDWTFALFDNLLQVLNA